MQIAYKNTFSYSSDKKAVLTVLIDGKPFRVKWGRAWTEPGNLPAVYHIPEYLLDAGAFECMTTKRVPVLATSYEGADNEGNPIMIPVPAGKRLSGLLVRYLEEKRVYLVSVLQAGRMVPKVI